MAMERLVNKNNKKTKLKGYKNYKVGQFNFLVKVSIWDKILNNFIVIRRIK